MFMPAPSETPQKSDYSQHSNVDSVSTPKFHKTPDSIFSLGHTTKQQTILAPIVLTTKRGTATAVKGGYPQKFDDSANGQVSSSFKQMLMQQIDQQLLICAELKYQISLL